MRQHRILAPGSKLEQLMEEQTADNVRWSVAGDIGRIVLDRSDGPHTISLASTAALARAVAEIAAAKPRVVLLTGSGTIFCAGGDIAEMRQHAGTLDVYIDELVGIAHPALLRLSELPVPVVTAINGPVGGGGIGWALCGDFALAAASMKLRTGYAAIGLSPDMGASHFITRRIGSLRARQLLMLSDPIDARRCLDFGLVDEVVPDAELGARAQTLCERLARAPTASMAGIKQLCEGAARRNLHEQMALEKSLIEARARSSDASEGVQAFLENRAPRFSGR
ncbi:MAG: enoyl-CoA hydratase-related protein [Hydrogenophaga sp.]|jgi:2-(1,2-epoxy-1,2-dihydrophenyl)acetyl-CoA isomerase|uniref:enoyl-CoA hydratase-related protein n=1 Tax=Hydrogenophaga sp. TaxID=1904254 RepID=UPI0025C2A22C|nr:enoyl-CoA hydratase-related protein [Hydrogenophaga sp.]MCG2656113.1 enoyl-CoA hydratase-related protein [Hydrogenophaga sp.]